MKVRVFLVILCFHADLITAQVKFSPDTEEDVQLQVTPLTPPVQITTIQCYASSPQFKVQYVTLDDNTAVYDLIDTDGYPVAGVTCDSGQNQYRTGLRNLGFIADPALIGGAFRLKATVDDNVSSLSKRTYSFSAPFNLTGSSVSAVLNSEFIWTCHVTSDYPVIEWLRDRTILRQHGILSNGSCATAGTSDSYIYKCQQSALTYTLTIPGSSLTEELQASIWRCKNATSEVKGSKFMELDIVVPVTKVTISPEGGSTLDVDENQTVTFTCTTNTDNPPPTILWFIGSSDVTSQAGPNRTTLTLNVTRIYHQASVRCMAWNSGNTTNLSDSTILNVRFPPANNQLLHITGYTSGQVLYENNPAMISIYCRQPGGNPVANMTFTCGSQTGTNENTATEAIRRLNLINDRDLNGQQCFCTSTHINGYMRNKSFSFTVYYPPSTPTITLSSSFPWKAPGTYNLSCNAVPGNPVSTVIIWKEGVSVLPITSKTYVLHPLIWTDNGRQLSCQVNNNFTLYQSIVLTSNVSTLQVEYDPVVTIEQDSLEVIERHAVKLNCSATGNPVPTVTWYRDSTPVTGSTMSTSTYRIVNVSRTSTGNYLCEARSSSTGSNVMQPDQKTLYLRVFYPPTVSIYLQNATEYTENNVIRCLAEGDPNNSTIIALQQKIGSTLIRNITSFTESSPGNVTLNIPRVSFQDMGTYTCLASNGIPDRNNQKIQTDTTYFNVITSAKFEMMQYTVRSDLRTPTAIFIPFYRNPPATESDIVWTKNSGSTDETLVPSANVSFSLRDTDVQQMLHGVDVTLRGHSAIMNITSFQSYYEGNYTLKIRGSHTDSTEVAIAIIRSGPPDTPSDFKSATRKVTSITLRWNKGSDGGHPRTFVILYKEKSSEVYNMIQIDDTTMNISITNEIKSLKPYTSYEFILYSFNEKGNSTGHIALVERTLKGDKTESRSIGPSMAGVAGGVTAGLLVIIVIAITIIVLRKKRQKPEKGSEDVHSMNQSSTYDDLQNIRDVHTYGRIGSNTDTHLNSDERSNYEELQSQRDAHTYDRLGGSTKKKQDLVESSAYEDLQVSTDPHMYQHIGSTSPYVNLEFH